DVPANTPAQYPGINGVATYSEGVFMGYRHYDARGIAPLFPFGFGLSYTNFRLSGTRLPPAPDKDGRLTVSVAVTNTGRRAGSEVVQVYVGHPAVEAVPEPPNQLAAFARVDLRPGQTRRIEMKINPRGFAHWDVATHAFVVTPGVYTVSLGTSSRDLPFSVRLSVLNLPPGAVPQ